MNFDFENLKACERNDMSLGYWKGTPVKSVSKRNVKKTDSKTYYVIYDDGNKFYRDGRIYGEVTFAGRVNEYDYTKEYDKPKPVKKAEKVVEPEIKTPIGEEIDKIMYDDKKLLDSIEKSVSKMLEEACKW